MSESEVIASLKRDRQIMLAALKRIAKNKVEGHPTLSAHVAKTALKEVDFEDTQAPRGVETHTSFLRLP